MNNTLPSEVRRILYNRDLPRQLRGRFADDPPDIIYERASLYSTSGVQVARELNRPLVVELNAPLAVEQAAYRRSCLGELPAQAERWTLTQANLVLVVSAALRDYVLELGVEADRVHVVPNGVDGKLFRPKSPQANGAGPITWPSSQLSPEFGTWPDQGSNERTAEGNGAPVLGFVGGLRPWHGVDILPRLMERLIPLHPGVRLVIAGEGPFRCDLQRGFDERGLSECVRFTGAVPHEEVPEWIGRFDVALAPYPRPEHPFYFSPLKLFEYMACGVPTVAARLGQIEEVVRDGETGMLYPPGDLDALADACNRLLCDAALREFQPQVLHAHFATEPAACARELVGELGVPFTFTAHGYDIYRRPPPDFAERAAAAGAVITVSRADARYIAKNFGLERSQLRIIPCGSDTQRFRPSIQPVEDRFLRDAPPLIVCVARLVAVKNLGLLLAACAALRSRGVAFRCAIVGDGKLRHEVHAEHARLGLEDVVELVGPAEQSEVLGWWQRASVAVLTSEREGMPVCLMEAAACGVPAVAPAVGGIPELVEDGVTGLLFPPGDRDALVAALERLLQNADAAIQMGNRARQRAVERFSIRRQVDRLVELWTELVRAEVCVCRSK